MKSILTFWQQVGTTLHWSNPCLSSQRCGIPKGTQQRYVITLKLRQISKEEAKEFGIESKGLAHLGFIAFFLAEWIINQLVSKPGR